MLKIKLPPKKDVTITAKLSAQDVSMLKCVGEGMLSKGLNLILDSVRPEVIKQLAPEIVEKIKNPTEEKVRRKKSDSNAKKRGRKRKCKETNIMETIVQNATSTIGG